MGMSYMHVGMPKMCTACYSTCTHVWTCPTGMLRWIMGHSELSDGISRCHHLASGHACANGHLHMVACRPPGLTAPIIAYVDMGTWPPWRRHLVMPQWSCLHARICLRCGARRVTYARMFRHARRLPACQDGPWSTITLWRWHLDMPMGIFTHGDVPPMLTCGGISTSTCQCACLYMSTCAHMSKMRTACYIYMC